MQKKLNLKKLRKLPTKKHLVVRKEIILNITNITFLKKSKKNKIMKMIFKKLSLKKNNRKRKKIIKRRKKCLYLTFSMHAMKININ